MNKNLVLSGYRIEIRTSKKDSNSSVFRILHMENYEYREVARYSCKTRVLPSFLCRKVSDKLWRISEKDARVLNEWVKTLYSSKTNNSDIAYILPDSEENIECPLDFERKSKHGWY